MDFRSEYVGQYIMGFRSEDWQMSCPIQQTKNEVMINRCRFVSIDHYLQKMILKPHYYI